MLDQILRLVTAADKRPSVDSPDDLQIAVAALLVEAARMDDHFDAAERSVIPRLLSERFALSSEVTGRLLASAEQAADRSAGLFRFTQLVVKGMNPDERTRIVEMLWNVAYADGVLDPAEDALVRRVAGLIFVSDKDRGAARSRVLRRLGVRE
jgi:uncharacterized tellurite resistance protein B-like protein